MAIHFGKFVHTQTGKYIMSILLGFGLASLFRTVCKEKECLVFYAPPLDQFEDKIYKNGDKCYKFSPVATKCNKDKKIVNFSNPHDLIEHFL
jgi:hypothetical protein